MRSARRALLTVLLAASAAGSAEPDGAVAGPLRWPDPRGTVSGSRRSAALPVTRAGRKLWEFRDEKYPISAPPVLWDGRLYLLGGIAGDQKLFGVDLLTGRRTHAKSLEGPVTRPSVWDHGVVLRTKLDEISVLRPTRSGFRSAWTFRPKLGELSDPIVFEGEIYAVGPDCLLRFQEGKRDPIWKTGREGIRGKPALYGDHVYVIQERKNVRRMPSVNLIACERQTGEPAAAALVAYYTTDRLADRGVASEITVLSNRVYVKSPAGLAAKGATMRNAGIPRKDNGRELSFGEPVRLYSFTTSPAVHADGLVSLSDDGQLAWVIWHGDNGAKLAGEMEQPDFFRQWLAPTVVGDVVYFGTWAADVKTLDVLWRLPHERLKYPVVPADRMIVVVDPDGGVIAYGD